MDNSIVFQHPLNIFTLYSDGSVTRPHIIPCVPASPEFQSSVATKDLHNIDSVVGLWVRVFLPESSQHNPGKQLPVVLYMHGGAYCVGDPAWPAFHNFCHRLALKSDSIWISVAYRLAPEHRLPAAYDDAFAAFKWLRSQAFLKTNGAMADPWLQKFADFSRCFIAGDSAGGAIAFNLAMRATGEDWAPLNVSGLVLVHQGIHAEARRHMSSDQDRRMYDLALPEGANFDYPPVNPLHPDGPSLSQISVYRNVLVAVAEKDFRFDLTLNFYEALKSICQNVQLAISEDEDHIFHLFDPECEEAKKLEKQIVDFLGSC